MSLFSQKIYTRESSKTSRLWLLLVAFLSALSIAASAHAATYYVATNGSDSNPGTQSAPFKTISKGSQKMAGGDTLLICKGTYNVAMWDGQDGFEFVNGTPGAYTRYAACPGDEGKVILMPPGRDFVVKFSTTSDYIELSGLILDGTNTNGYVVKIDGSWSENQWPRVRLLRNELRHGWMGIGGGGNAEIIGNKIHHMQVYGLYSAGDHGFLEGNTFHDNGGFGIHIFQEEHRVNAWIIRNNVFFNNGSGYIHRDTKTRRTGPAVLIAHGANNQFYNNLIYNNPHGGIIVYRSASDSLVANNTIYGNGNYGISTSGTVRNTRLTNNISWGNNGPQIRDNGTNTSLENNLTTDPKFVNPGAGDFGVQAGSPAIDKGMTLAQVPDDFTSKKRPEGAAYDIGAFEGDGPRGGIPPGMAGGLPAGVGGGSGGGGRPVLLGPNGEVCPSGF